MQIEPKGKECAGCKRSGANILTHKDMDINVGVQGNLKKKIYYYKPMKQNMDLCPNIHIYCQKYITAHLQVAWNAPKFFLTPIL